MSDQVICETCRFYDESGTSTKGGVCRRYAPKPYSFYRYYNSELIRDIALTLRKPKRDYSDRDQDVETEATEAVSLIGWPIVEAYDWCGEHEQKESLE